MTEALVFDLDDTLFPERQYVLSGIRAVGEWLRLKYGLEEFSQHAITLFHEGERHRIFDRTLDAFDFNYDQRLIETLVEVYRTHYPDLSLYEDARWILDHYSTTFRLGLITDGFAVAQARKLEALAVRDYFEVVVLTDLYGRSCWKPDSFAYLKVMDELSVPAARCVYVGDNPTKDFVTANRLGWKTVRILREYGQYAGVEQSGDYNANITIRSLFELPTALEASCVWGGT